MLVIAAVDGLMAVKASNDLNPAVLFGRKGLAKKDFRVVLIDRETREKVAIAIAGNQKAF